MEFVTAIAGDRPLSSGLKELEPQIPPTKDA